MVLVVREKMSQKRILKDSVKQLKHAGIKVFGFVFNDVSFNKNGYYNKYYGYGYYNNGSK